MRNEGLIKNYVAGSQISPYRVVRFENGGTGKVQEAGGGWNGEGLPIGVADRQGAAAAGDRVEVIRSGIVEVEYSAVVAEPGTLLIYDSVGRVRPADSALGSINEVVGIAEVSGNPGDIGSMMIDIFKYFIPL